ncbi:helix-turn-helix transcriptional regulator [Virgifigura deserti]|uniref:helix-turn-helix transcriptional regulator n=1 Tax=Virgifigura deserti TaxID=2268457 RepID=UPI003CCBB3B5
MEVQLPDLNSSTAPVADSVSPAGNDPLYDEDAAGRYLGGEDRPVSARSMQRWRLEGIGPAYVKIGRLVRYRRSALDTFLAAGERRSTSDTGGGDAAA